MKAGRQWKVLLTCILQPWLPKVGVWGEKRLEMLAFQYRGIVATSVDGYHILVTHMSRLAIIIRGVHDTH